MRSLLASINSTFRSWESQRAAQDQILWDPYARYFYDFSWKIQVIRLLRFLIPGLYRTVDQLQTVHCVRHRTVDEVLRESLRAEPEAQVVIFGAGYDTRFFRFQEEFPKTTFFEIDTPATQKRKKEILVRRGDVFRNLDRLKMISANLETDPWFAQLLKSGFRSSAPTIIILEGLIHYLSPETVRNLLSASFHQGKLDLIVSFITPQMHASATKQNQKLLQSVKEVPMLTFSEEELGRWLASAGFQRTMIWDYTAQVQQFAPQSARRKFGVSQHVAHTSR
ncbi:MAG: class I SAM-dependent methyltransferase [Bdellovibrionales bacterium]|nr:class I SAM-dependent methyltransferase [Bdellovibrionales bacterium]